MAKTTIIGTLTEIDTVLKKDDYSSQTFRIAVEEFDSETGKARPVQVFPVTVFNKKIKELNPEQFKDKRVRCTAYLKSVMRENEGKVFFNILLNASTLEPA